MFNILRFCQNREQLDRTLNVSDNSRLQGLVESVDDCHLQMTGERLASGQMRLRGSVSATLHTQCQVCMQALTVNHDFEFELHPVTESQLEGLDEDLDPIVYEHESLDVVDMVVNELILSLPPVHSHLAFALEDCSSKQKMTTGVGEIPQRNSPFDVLASLKSKGSKN